MNDNVVDAIRLCYRFNLILPSRDRSKPTDPLHVRIQSELRSRFGLASEYNQETGILVVKSESGEVIEEFACTPIVPSKGVLIQPIKAGIFIPDKRVGLTRNMERYSRLRNQIMNWQNLQVVGYFGAQRMVDQHLHVTFTFCQPDDFLQYSGVDKKVSLTLLHNKMHHERPVEVEDVNQLAVFPSSAQITTFPISAWMHNTSITPRDTWAGRDCIYLFHKTIQQQCRHFINRCMFYFKEERD